MLTLDYIAPSEFSDIFDAMDNAGWYFRLADDTSGDQWGPFDSEPEARAYASQHVACPVGGAL